MRPRFDAGFYAGLVLILAGVLLTVSGLPSLAAAAQLVVAAAFVAGAAVLAGVFVSSRTAWTLPAAATALAIGLLIGIDGLFPGRAGEWAGSMMFTLIGAAFLVLAAVPRIRWWPLIPGGVMLSLAATIPTGKSGLAGGIFLAGLGVTFAAVYVVPPQPMRRVWAAITAGVLLVLALPASGLSGQVLGIAVAVALIGAGLVILVRGARATT